MMSAIRTLVDITRLHFLWTGVFNQMIKKNYPIKFLGPLANYFWSMEQRSKSVWENQPRNCRNVKIDLIKLLGPLANYSQSMEQRSNSPTEMSHTVIGQRSSVPRDAWTYTMYKFVGELCGAYAVQYKWQDPCYDNINCWQNSLWNNF